MKQLTSCRVALGLFFVVGCSEPSAPAVEEASTASSPKAAPASATAEDTDLAGPALREGPPPGPAADDDEASGGAASEADPRGEQAENHEAADDEAAIDESEEGDEASFPVAALGELLPGDDSLPVMQVSLVRGAPASTRFGPKDVLLDRLDATLDINATVGEVNQALEEVGARVCKTEGPRIPFTVMLCIPPQRDPAAVQRVADRLKRSRGITHAAPIIGSPPHVVGP